MSEKRIDVRYIEDLAKRHRRAVREIINEQDSYTLGLAYQALCNSYDVNYQELLKRKDVCKADNSHDVLLDACDSCLVILRTLQKHNRNWKTNGCVEILKNAVALVEQEKTNA